jgi:hypothetical protein
MKKFKTFTDILANIATVIVCIVTVVGVYIGSKFVIEIQPIVEKHFTHSGKTVERIRDTVKIIYRDTGIVVRRDTIFFEKPVPQDRQDLNFKEYMENTKKEFDDYVNQQKKEFKSFVDNDRKEFENFLKTNEDEFKKFLDGY